VKAVALRLLTIFALCLTLMAGAALAQGSQAPLTASDYEAWERLASRAEDVIDRARASNGALEILRAQINEARTAFAAGRTANTARIATLRDQIAALGPLPAEGVAEPEDITQRRATLEAQLRALEAPGLVATEAFQRAGGLIGEVDQIIATRQTEAFFAVERGAVDVSSWAPAAKALVDYWDRLKGEVERAYDTEFERTAVLNSIVPLGLYIIVALLLLFRAGPLVERAKRALLPSLASASGRVIHFFASLARMALPLLGVVAVTQALDLAGLTGLRLDALIDALVPIGITIYAARWLATMAFPKGEQHAKLLDMSPQTRAQARRQTLTLAILLAVSQLLDVLDNTSENLTDYVSVLNFPVILFAGIVLIRMALTVLRSPLAEAGVSEGSPVLTRALPWVAKTVIVVGAVTPVLALVGYATAASLLIWPTIISLGLWAFLLSLQALITDIFAWVMKRTEDADEALIPTLIGISLWGLALPVFALIWGVRWATLTELWSRFLSGASIGGTVISPSNFITFAIVFAIGYMITRTLQGVLRNSVLPKTKLDSGGKNAILSGAGYVGFFIAALVAITLAGIDLSGLAIVAGALSVGIGFGLQTIVSNFVSGIILLIERPIKLGDWISVGSVSGYVRDISVRSTRIETFDRQDVIVPNADLIAGVVTNYTLGNTTGRVIVPVGVAYGTDTRRVEAILQEIAEAHPMVLLNPGPTIVFQGFGADSLDFEIRAFLRDVNWMLSVKSEMNHAIADRFVREGIEIPFAQRDVWLRNPEALRDAPPTTEPDPSSKPETP
jgi:small-conductance mechanosensitive channel